MSVGTSENGLDVSPVTRRERRRRFLRALAKSGEVRAAAKASGWSTVEWYRQRRDDPRFARAWQRALKLAVARADAELRRRGIEGWDETTTETHLDSSGAILRRVERVKHVRDTPALLAWLRAHHDAYRDRQEVTHRLASPLVDAERQRLALADPAVADLYATADAALASLPAPDNSPPATEPGLDPPESGNA